MLKQVTTLKGLEKKFDTLVYAAPENLFKKKLHTKVLPNAKWDLVDHALKSSTAGSKGTIINTWTGETTPSTFSVIMLPEKVSHYNSPARREQLYSQLTAIKTNKSKNIGIVISIDDPDMQLAVSCAVQRYTCYINRKVMAKEKTQVHLLVTDSEGSVLKMSDSIQSILDAMVLSIDIVNAPPSDLGPDAYAKLIRKTFEKRKHTSLTEIKGEELLKSNLSGIYNVGRGSNEKPRLIVVDYKPSSFKKTVVLVGKGLTYDTGGLSLKTDGNLVGMKMDLGGSAAVVGALDAIIKQEPKVRVIAALGVVENMIGPNSYKVDDIITMHSGKTVEINNTDAEGRVVLADCLSFTARKYNPDYIVDAATLTGAQMIATGRYFAGLMSNDAELESIMVNVGKKTGDLMCALPFAPEYFEDELMSELADMKNSAKDRFNAPSSAAAQFLFNHISDLDTPWAHIDMAGQAMCAKNIATGYGVALLAELVQSL
jgi:probable aminopeptidase NPEPL1